jgi:hypothetical protein
MKSKKPPNRRIQNSGATTPARDSEQSGEAIILDFTLNRIKAFNQEQGGGVSVRKDLKGYTLVREDNGRPIARLRPRGTHGNFEILYLGFGSDRWRKVGAFGGTILPLDEALEFIAEDPMDCFWR